MEDSELVQLYRQMESDRVERKAVFKPLKDAICQTICAFANDLPARRQPGVIFIGVKDTGACESITVGDKLLREITDIRGEGKILPLPIMQVRRAVLDGCEVAVIIVEPMDSPPVSYNGEIYVRVGPSCRRATREEERRLIEKRSIRDFDVQPLQGASIDDLDRRYLEEEYIPNAVSRRALVENERTPEQRLSALRLTDVNGIPTVLGALVGGIDPRYLLPGAYIQFLRVAGGALTDPIKDQEEISGQIRDGVCAAVRPGYSACVQAVERERKPGADL